MTIEKQDIAAKVEFLKQESNLIAEGASEDIWYDAKDFGEHEKQAHIDNLQAAMITIGEGLPKALEALALIESLLASHPDANNGNTKVHLALCKAREALNSF